MFKKFAKGVDKFAAQTRRDHDRPKDNVAAKAARTAAGTASRGQTSGIVGTPIADAHGSGKANRDSWGDEATGGAASHRRPPLNAEDSQFTNPSYSTGGWSQTESRYDEDVHELDSTRGNNLREPHELDASPQRSSAAYESKKKSQGFSSTEDHGQNNGRQSSDRARESRNSDSRSYVDARVAEARGEMHRVESVIWKAAKERMPDVDVHAVFKKYGVDSALQSLLDTYQPTLEHMSHMQSQIRTAAQELKIPHSNYKAVSEKHGAAGTLELVIARFQTSVSAEHSVSAIKRTIQTATADIIQRVELDHAYDNRHGVEGMVNLLIEKLVEATSARNDLVSIGVQIKDTLHYMPRKERDTAFEAMGERGLVNLLLREFRRFSQADKEASRLGKELSTLRSRYDTVTSDSKTKLQMAEQKHKNEKNDMKLRYDEQLNKTKELSEKRNTEWRASYQAAEQRHKKEVAETSKLHDEQLSNMQDLLSKNTAEWDAILQSSEQTHKDEVAETKKQHEEQMAILQDRLDQANGKWRTTVQSLEKKHKDELAEIKQRYDESAAERESRFAQEGKDLEAKHREGIRALMEQNQSLKVDIADREHIKGISDQAMQTMFKKLARDIDNFSRLSWEKLKQPQWPLPEGTLMRAKNPKKMKQLLVQNSLWLVLYERIFQSPFAIFGDEGRRLHREWTLEHGQGQGDGFDTWPEAVEDTEKQRYEIIAGYLAAAKSPATMSEENHELKLCYLRSIDDIVGEIHDAVETVANSDSAWLHEIVKKAAEFWLSLASQRYRARLYLPAGTIKTLKGPKMSSSTRLKLMIQPELRRRGNSEGGYLSREQVVQGCEGQSSTSDEI